MIINTSCIKCLMSHIQVMTRYKIDEKSTGPREDSNPALSCWETDAPTITPRHRYMQNVNTFRLYCVSVTISKPPRLSHDFYLLLGYDTTLFRSVITALDTRGECDTRSSEVSVFMLALLIAVERIGRQRKRNSQQYLL